MVSILLLDFATYEAVGHMQSKKSFEERATGKIACNQQEVQVAVAKCRTGLV